jgi:hypothetical protein
VTADSETGLTEALKQFLGEAKRIVDDELNRKGAQPPSTQALAQSLAALPACREADAIARRTARSNDYEMSGLHPRSRTGISESAAEAGKGLAAAAVPSSAEVAEPYGRPLDADALISTGVVGLLLDQADVDLHVVATDLAGYLAGPPVPIWDYAILDGNLTVDEPILVADHWELAAPTAEQLGTLLPVPSASVYQPNRPFDPKDYSGLTMLRRVRPNALPRCGHALRFDVLYSLAIRRPAYSLWQPLLVLSLFENPVLQLWARYEVEPARRLDRLFDSVEWEVWTPDDETEIEQPRTGDWGLEADVARLQRFLTEPPSWCISAWPDSGQADQPMAETTSDQMSRLQASSGCST